MNQDISAMSAFGTGVWIVCSLAVWYMYHKLFKVTYFNFSKACFAELCASAFIGMMLAGLVMRFWYIAILVIIVLVFAIGKKK